MDPKPADSKPNLLLIVVDCLRADRCPPAGPTDLKAWARLRDSGAAFTQTISSASWTPVCFAGLLTGAYSFVHGVRTIRGPALDPGLPTLAALLGQAGYSTHAFVVGPMIDALGMNRGFAEYAHRPKDAYVHGEWGRRFLARYDAIVARPQPWFVLLHLFEVHCPRQTNGLPAKEHTEGEYDLAWRQLDGWIAGLLDRTPANTVVSLTSDHAESVRRRADRTPLGHLWRKARQHARKPRCPDDWRRHGYHVFDEIVRIPWVVSSPGHPRPAVIDQQVRQVDIAPTLIEIVGQAVPAMPHGRSVVGLLRGECMEEVPAYVESGCDDPLRDWHGLREPGWKYAEHPREGENIDPEAMLFDLSADPDERRNVIRKHPQVALRMRRQLDAILHFQGALRPAGQPIAEQDQARLTEQLKALGYL